MTDPPEQNPLLSFLDHLEERPDVVVRRRRSYELLDVRPGARVADVGCGAGAAVRELAPLVAPGGRSIGVDINEPLIEVARRRAKAASVDVDLHVASADALPFERATLDAYRAERVYQHLPDPGRALAEAQRVLVPGGRVVFVDQDWDALLIDSDDPATTRAMIRAFGDGILNSGIGRHYHALLLDSGFTDVVVEAEANASTSWDDYGFLPETMALGVEASGALPSKVVKNWVEEQRDRARRGRFFLTMTHFLARARTRA